MESRIDNTISPAPLLGVEHQPFRGAETLWNDPSGIDSYLDYMDVPQVHSNSIQENKVLAQRNKSTVPHTWTTEFIWTAEFE
ncbi:MAG: hypothetical protein R6X27_03140 [Candidatus Desulfacyla sp.]